MNIITDTTVVDPSSLLRDVRYIAPELMNPKYFGLSDSNPTKESDIYSLAVTVYEVRLSQRLVQSLLTPSAGYKTLTGVLPYGNTPGSVISIRIVDGDRPSRPSDARWLTDQIWNMITACWNQKRELRWDIHAIYDQFSASSVQEITEAGKGDSHACSIGDMD